MAIKNSIIETIGKTPIIKLNSIETFGNEIYVKLEGANPGRSTKDRIALKIVEDAERKNLINKDTVIIEATSGNTGIALAMICAVKKYKLIIIMPDTMSIERQKLLKAYGAELILTDGHKGMKECLKKMDELKEQYPNHFIPDQFKNPNNPLAHYEGTAVEILNDMENNLDIFIAGTGTGGSFSGTAKKLKEELPNIKTFSVEPSNSPLLTKGYIGSHKIQGMGMSAGFIPPVYDNELANEVLVADDDIAFDYTMRLAREEGILAGISTGAVVSAAVNYAREHSNKKLKIVVLSTDSGEKYLSEFI
ncbi:cysteine synthase A [Cetobacterium sp. SF1]|uniref:cysteine synthase A n=1 Tax=unclassified Cetobacterium TaxID=2630983 RepID=UPI003CF6D5F6